MARDRGTEAGRSDIEREQGAEQFRQRDDLLEQSVGEVQVAHRAEIPQLHRTAAVERRVEARLALEEAGQRLAIRRVEVGDFARRSGSQPERRDHGLGALAQEIAYLDSPYREALAGF